MSLKKVKCISDSGVKYPRRITVETTKEIISKHENGVCVSDLPTQYNMVKSTICTILKNEKIYKVADVGKGVTILKKNRTPLIEEIDDGEIHASINQRDGMVVFLDNPEKYNSPTMMAQLDKEMQLCMEVERRLQAMEEEIVVNPQYVQKVLGPQEDEGPTPSSAQSSSFSIASSM
ncbi:COP9 signalosome complex subunit 3 [Halocaridina rubra]|uniref:COP9 signalosome complex subunit 3 n=1 Tax=Halocaridina rubra TaxID=373956 RepID=A0AAN8XJL2_HALRR